MGVCQAGFIRSPFDDIFLSIVLRWLLNVAIQNKDFSYSEIIEWSVVFEEEYGFTQVTMVP